MKKLYTIALAFLLVSLLNTTGFAQEKYGSTLNLGLGIGGYSGYYKYSGHTLPVLNINYEFDVAKNFTLAPFISLSSFANRYKDGNGNYYMYRETVVPIGVKGTYYLDGLVKTSSAWDIYVAGSLGFAIVNTRWDANYYGDKNMYRRGNPLFMDLHLGAEYHFNNRIGAFLDLSTGVSTLGIAIH